MWSTDVGKRKSAHSSSAEMRTPTKPTAAVIGGGPAGLLTAVMLAQRNIYETINVYDARPPPLSPSDPSWGAGERSYQLGLNGRGQKSLREFDAMERVSAHAAYVQGRLSFDKSGQPNENRLKPPGTKGAEKTYTTRVLQRDRLQACLVEELRVRYADKVTLNFGVACDGVDLDGERPAVRLCASDAASDVEECAVDVGADTDGAARESRVEADLVVGADGVRSAVRESLAAAPGSTTRTVRYVNDNERVYKTLPLHPSAVPGTASDLNWGCRNTTIDLGMDALPTAEGEMVAVLLFKPGTPTYERIEQLATADDAKAFLAASLPPLAPYVRDDELARFVERPISRLPSFQCVEGDIHHSLPRGGVVVLGDAIKAVKPYFGQGANSALEDVSILKRCLDESGDEPAAAARAFSAARGDDARALVRISRGFDRPGPLGTARFLLPLLLDIQLNKLLPAVFSPPTLRGLQDERNSFIGLERRKRRERVVLLGLLGALAAGAKRLLFV